jgi:hypothetical protein
MSAPPSTLDIADDVAAAGLQLLTVEPVTEVYAANRAEAAGKLSMRAVSLFEPMSEMEIEEGFERLDERLAAGKYRTDALKVEDDPLVLGRPAA